MFYLAGGEVFKARVAPPACGAWRGPQPGLFNGENVCGLEPVSGESERRWVIDYRCMLINGVIGASFWQKNLTFAKGRHAREKKRLC